MLLLLELKMLGDIFGFSEIPNVEYLMTDKPAQLPAELIAALNSEIMEKRSATSDNKNETDLVDIKNVPASVDGIARVPSELSGEKTGILTQNPTPTQIVEPNLGSSVSGAPFRFKGKDSNEWAPFRTISRPATETGGPITAAQIRDLIKADRLRDQYFDAELFADSAWDILLDLMAARLERKRMSVSSLCIAASVPPTTALR